jgi:histidinol dehydrogenase
MSPVWYKAPAPHPGPDEVAQVVAGILADVRARGDAAVREHTRRFDGIDRPSPVVPRQAALAALDALDPPTREALQWAHDHIAAFARAQRDALHPLEVEVEPGVRAGHRLLPVGAAGCYVPGGRYPLPSTALMTIVPARVAGVRRVAACAPPGPDGQIHPVTLAAMALAGADEIYCMGGAQAVAALAFGTDTVAPVDVVVGPGNRYVVEAKRQVYGTVGVDLLAGPSEVCVVADGSAAPELVVADLLAQAEHDPDARAVLVTTEERLAQAVVEVVAARLRTMPAQAAARRAWEGRGEVVLVADVAEAASVVDRLAPEHVLLHLRDPAPLAERLTAYGALFIGPSSAEVFGDYGVGPTHVLPTGGAARFASGLWVGHFLRVAPYLEVSPAGAAPLVPVAARLAEVEGLPGHAYAARLRLP